ncbi:hypothetical protein AVEN_104202-1 [Araneus ventricosus]|uniref:Uncharacterized protein n=1 Tax=Araneus ventricosus TaxID=182803 RepID=A0A4Y2ING5_ARAVE|nr:hypothetical protein AVEN_104202-1 [Araneus ventricosus]
MLCYTGVARGHVEGVYSLEFWRERGDRWRIDLEIDPRFETRFSRSEKIEKSDLGAGFCTCTGVLRPGGIEANPWLESSFGELQRIRAFL